MSINNLTLNQIRTIGLEALARELGPVGMVRFLQQYETGSSDYTQDRKKWLPGMDVKTLWEKIDKQRPEQ